MLTLQNVTITLPKQKITLLQDVTLQITPQMRTAIMGLNGAGKTTLLNVLAGTHKPSQGELLWQSENFSNLSAREKAKRVAFVPQDFPTDFPFTVAEFALMGRFAQRQGFFDTEQDGKTLDAVLQRMELVELRHRSIETLSGGEKQRLLLARALLQNTPMLLLDEPANHLDIRHKFFLFDLLNIENKTQKTTIVAVLHDFADVAQNFDDVIFVKNGKIVFHGPVAQALQPDLLQQTFDVAVPKTWG